MIKSNISYNGASRREKLVNDFISEARSSTKYESAAYAVWAVFRDDSAEWEVEGSQGCRYPLSRMRNSSIEKEFLDYAKTIPDQLYMLGLREGLIIEVRSRCIYVEAFDLAETREEALAMVITSCKKANSRRGYYFITYDQLRFALIDGNDLFMNLGVIPEHFKTFFEDDGELKEDVKDAFSDAGLTIHAVCKGLAIYSESGYFEERKEFFKEAASGNDTDCYYEYAEHRHFDKFPTDIKNYLWEKAKNGFEE
ncbi:MAG: hypothetical protein IKE91_07650 [Clostridia bacterium]|nr:hypothetical protein [Clostridia bacterium]